MQQQYKIVYRGGAGEYVEKKSRFIATVKPVESEEQAFAYIEELKKKYWDARHHCYAFVVGERMQLQRFSDDGEPQGTAGKPILDVLLGGEIHNCLIVVTRYFGGTLLGTGGLVRAYGKASREGLEHSIIVEKMLGQIVTIRTDYNGVGKIQYLLGQRNIPIMNSEYTQDVVLEVLADAAQLDAIWNEVTEITGGKANMQKGREVYFANNQKELLVFEQ